MNKDKIIKDLKERNDKLENQRRQFEMRLYHEQYLVEEKDKEIEKLKKELFSKPDNEITLKTTDGQTMTIIQSERIDMQEKLNKSLEEMYKKYNDYKSRCEKALEYIKCGITGDLENDRAYVDENALLNILNGGDKDEKK